MPTTRARVLGLLLVLLALGAAPIAARAQPSVEIEWATTGSGPVQNPNVVAEVGDQLTATFYLENVGGAIAGYTIGVTYDSAELSLVSSTEYLPSGFSANLTTGTATQGLCSGFMFDGVLLSIGSGVSGRFAIGQAVFDVDAVIDDGQPDVETGPCSGTTDEAIFDDAPSDVTASTSFESARSKSVVVAPALGSGVWGLYAAMLGVGSWLLYRRRRGLGTSAPR